MVSVRVDVGGFRRSPAVGVREESVALAVAPGPAPIGGGWGVALPGLLQLRLRGNARRISVEADADLQFRCPCDRCLTWVDVPLHVAYTEEWVLGGEPLPEDDGQITVRPVAGNEVDPSPEFWQNVALELPAKVLCGEGCRGLCPRCGADRNRDDCGCGPAEDPRLAALRGWRPGSPATGTTSDDEGERN